jgi:hypothetical protein
VLSFFDIAENGPAPIANEALARIAALYAIEGPQRRSVASATPGTEERSKPLVHWCWVLALKTALVRHKLASSAPSSRRPI